jgi:hypothetical protein
MSSTIINTTLSKAITSADGFHHLVYSISGTTHTLFLDNSAIAVNVSGGNIFSSYQTITNLFCGIAGDLSYGYSGYIDDFKVFNRALFLTDVSAIYNTVKVINFMGPLDNLSTAAKTAMLYSGTGSVLQSGAYGIKLLYSKYTGPSIQIKNGTSGTPTDFYPALDGTNTLSTSTGTSLTSFLSGAIAYVTKWYDQTGNGHDATAQGATLPFLNTTTYEVDFGPNGYFTLANNSFPTGNLPYTYLYKQGRIDTTTSNTPYSGGDAGYGIMELLIVNFPGGIYLDGWYAYDAVSATGILTPNAVHAMTYGGGGNNSTATGRILYINNAPITFGYNYINSYRNQSASNCYLGTTQLGYGTYKSTMPYFYWMPYQLGSSDRIILGNT